MISIFPELSRRCPEVDPDDHHLYVRLDCAAENLLLAAEAAGLKGYARPSTTSLSRLPPFARSLPPTRESQPAGRTSTSASVVAPRCRDRCAGRWSKFSFDYDTR